MSAPIADPGLAVTKPLHPAVVKEACVAEALAIIESEGLESLSLRDVARRLGVPHQAPYKHFPTRDHLVAEITRRVFDHFAQYIDARPRHPDPDDDFRAMGVAYIQYAIANPFYYRLMYAAPPLNPSDHPAMARSAQHVTGMLYKGLRDVFAAHGITPTSAHPTRDALFVWSTLHGFVTLTQTQAMAGLLLPPGIRDSFVAHLLERIGGALGLVPTPADASLQPAAKSDQRTS